MHPTRLIPRPRPRPLPVVARPRPRRRRPLRSAASALVALVLLLSACSGGGDTADSAETAAAPLDVAPATAIPTAEAAQAAEEAAAEDVGFEAAAPAPDGDAALEDADDAAADDAPAPDGAPPPQTATTGERIIKEGTISLDVEPGSYDQAFGQVVDRAQALGGHVAGTSSATHPVEEPQEGQPDRLTSGQVTVRVPVRAFEDLITAVGDAGEVTDRNVTSQDVSAEYVDLESRRRNLQAQERFYLGLLDQAASVQDAIAVQQQLDGIQEQIEQITGRLNLLADRTAFSTLTVRITERGAAPAADEVEPVEEPGGLTPYVEDAVDTFVATVGSLIVVLTFLSPFLLLAAAAYLVWRTATRSRRARSGVAPLPVPPPAAPAAPAAPAPEPVTAGAPVRAHDDDRA